MGDGHEVDDEGDYQGGKGQQDDRAHARERVRIFEAFLGLGELLGAAAQLFLSRGLRAHLRGILDGLLGNNLVGNAFVGRGGNFRYRGLTETRVRRAPPRRRSPL